MKIKTTIVLLVVLASLLLTSTALASSGTPTNACAPGFELMPYMSHEGDHEHMHTHRGVDADLNGDGFVCMKVLPNNMHLHIDNRLPLG